MSRNEVQQATLERLGELKVFKQDQRRSVVKNTRFTPDDKNRILAIIDEDIAELDKLRRLVGKISDIRFVDTRDIYCQG